MSHETRRIDRCRVCGGEELKPLLDLGLQALTGIFPASTTTPVAAAPLELVKCARSDGCGLVQLHHTHDLRDMYGRHYGYRSSLNASMVKHLRDKIDTVLGRVRLAPGDVVLDIGSNDGTLLKSYPPTPGVTLLGIDPTGLAEYYPDSISFVPDFFSAAQYRRIVGARNARVVTSIAMFYDLEAPLEFAREVAGILAPDGVWLFEQSYAPEMLRQNAYDTVCHEHLEYYCLRQVKWILDRAGLKIVDVSFDDTNGGSFAVMAALTGAPYPEASATISSLLAAEEEQGLETAQPWHEFRERVFAHRDELRSFVSRANAEGRRILGYGASTKGNVVLQFCGFGPADIPCIAEVNQDKFGHFTPGTLIPIVSEAEARARRPDLFLVLPWHFRRAIARREAAYLREGGRLVMPLPRIEVLDGTCPEAADA